MAGKQWATCLTYTICTTFMTRFGGHASVGRRGSFAYVITDPLQIHGACMSRSLPTSSSIPFGSMAENFAIHPTLRTVALYVHSPQPSLLEKWASATKPTLVMLD
mmetsp:Transcript_25827/g.71271  ORF Transcript_25827/g.71271 Transcript_25827/m.71271 type:complete len:105 (+) Transcript_25827:874-1188(+)